MIDLVEEKCFSCKYFTIAWWLCCGAEIYRSSAVTADSLSSGVVKVLHRHSDGAVDCGGGGHCGVISKHSVVNALYNFSYRLPVLS